MPKKYSLKFNKSLTISKKYHIVLFYYFLSEKSVKTKTLSPKFCGDDQILSEFYELKSATRT